MWYRWFSPVSYSQTGATPGAAGSIRALHPSALSRPLSHGGTTMPVVARGTTAGPRHRTWRRSWPISRLLLLFALVPALPVFAGVVVGLWQLVLRERQDRDDSARDAAVTIGRDIDLRLQGYIDFLKTLATSAALQSDDVEAAYEQTEVSYLLS